MAQWITLAFVVKERTDLINNNTQINKEFMDNSGGETLIKRKGEKIKLETKNIICTKQMS